MTLITSISGIRGTLGGEAGEGLTPTDILKFVTAFVEVIKSKANKGRITVVVGRDGRSSGEALSRLVSGILQLCGANVIDLGLSTTPTVAMAVPFHRANGGIILTASHNPSEWNALKLLQNNGEFFNELDGTRVVSLANDLSSIKFPIFDKIGSYSTDNHAINRHIDAILKLTLVDVKAIKSRHLTVAFDAVNSSGGIALPPLLNALGVERIIPINNIPDGNFSHNPEPLAENLKQLSEEVEFSKADLGFAVDPDVDRLAIISEDGSYFGEEYTLVSIADYVLGTQKGNSVSNLSSSRALKDITIKHGGQYFATAVGEVNVVAGMKRHNAIIGGEGNGGIIAPQLHYGRDALVGIALFLSHYANQNIKCSELRKKYPDYYISKNKIEIDSSKDISVIFKALEAEFPEGKTNYTDGLKLDMEMGWIHLRKSNTEPIIRIYAEAASQQSTEALIEKTMRVIRNI